jgi:hypothetical protein
MIRRWLAAIYITIGCFVIYGTAAHAQQVVPPEAPKWCEYAQKYIEKNNGKPFECKIARRCTRMNNYGCVKQASSKPLLGTTWGGYSSGARDSKGHALFEHPKYSLLKMIGLLARYQRDGLKSALAIQERYAPWCDTLGSAQFNRGWGRSCRGEPKYPAAPVGYSPMCKMPPNRMPLPRQCSACNCPSKSSEVLVAGTGLSTTEPLKLFDAAGKAQPLMVNVLRNLARQEQGVRITELLAQEAVETYNVSIP